MKHVRNSVLAASAFTCATLLSFGWSSQGGVSLSVESAQARVGRPGTPVSVAGVARRQARRGAYGYGYGAAAVGAGIAAAGTAAAVAATSPHWGSDPYYANTGDYQSGPYYGRRYHRGAVYGTGYYGGGPYEAYGSYGYPAQDYATRNGFVCHPGGTVKLDDGHTYLCQ